MKGLGMNKTVFELKEPIEVCFSDSTILDRIHDIISCIRNYIGCKEIIVFGSSISEGLLRKSFRSRFSDYVGEEALREWDGLNSKITGLVGCDFIEIKDNLSYECNELFVVGRFGSCSHSIVLKHNPELYYEPLKAIERDNMFNAVLRGARQLNERDWACIPYNSFESDNSAMNLDKQFEDYFRQRKQYL